MNNLRDLFLNPITLIGLILALIFIAMGYFRHLGIKRAHAERERDIKPIKVSDPYAQSGPVTPPLTVLNPPPPPPPASPPRLSSPPPDRTFRMFGKSGAMHNEKSGYVWE